MKLDSKGRINLGKDFWSVFQTEEDQVKMVFYAVLQVKNNILAVISAEPITRETVISFLSEYLGNGNFREDFTFEGYLQSIIDKQGRINLSDELFNKKMLEKGEELPQFLPRKYQKLNDKSFVSKIIRSDDTIRKEQITKIFDK